ncbi:S-layer homology domain-containing protein [Paenibacillus methanolicus]|uniref:Tol biopolymer transport system component n=1 Tax=Paenibacillus methanolicus TaxID=582686 RepID=A0A5S5CJB8_9BACL|nr:S-layer homology domain-containing protein [Paenibacillus methanolicus]TYP78113.1 Tol biopolymer transport system component [Paenibacillus methanolicus]
MVGKFNRKWRRPIAAIIAAALMASVYPAPSWADPSADIAALEAALEEAIGVIPSAGAGDAETSPAGAGEQSPSGEAPQQEAPQEEVRLAEALAAPAPVLQPLRAYTNEAQVRLAGSAEAGAAVTVYRIDPKRIKSAVGTVGADGEGAFAIDAALETDGPYQFTAIAKSGATTSPESAPVQLTLDRTAPAAPRKAEWTTEGTDAITLSWQSAEAPGSLAFHILREGEEVGVTNEEQYQDSGLVPQSRVRYGLFSEDPAGNRSAVVELTAGTQPERLMLVGTSESGEVANSYVSGSAISADGSAVAFYSSATNLIPGVGDGDRTLLYVKDLNTNKVEVAEPEPDFNGGSEAALSGTGRYLVYNRYNGEHLDLYLKDREQEGPPVRITSGDGDSLSPSISDDGSTIVFVSAASNLTADDDNRLTDAFVYRTATGTITRIAPPPTGYGYDVQKVVLSGNGQYAAWLLMESGVEPAREQTVLYSLASGAATTIAEQADSVSISRDGRFAAYSVGLEHYLYDRTTGEASLLYGENNASPIISADGQWLAYGDGGQASWEHLGSGDALLLGNPATEDYVTAMSANGQRLLYLGDYPAERNEYGGFRSMAYVVCPITCSGDTSEDRPIESVSWTAAGRIKDQLKFGSELTLTTVGAAGGSSSVAMTYRTAAGEETEALERVVTLTESSVKPGTYSGKLKLAEGMAQLISIVGEITDRNGISTTKAADRMPAAVSGAIAADIALLPEGADPKALEGSRLVAWSAQRKSGAQLAYSQGQETLLLPLAAAPDYSLKLVAADGTVLAAGDPIEVVQGHAAERKLEVRLPAHLGIRILKPDGSGLAGVEIAMKDAEGELIGSGVTDALGNASIDSGFAGENVALSYDMPRPYLSAEPESIMLETVTVVTKTAEVRNGIVQGSIKDERGNVITGGTITLSQPNSVTSAPIAANGAYSIEAPEGISNFSIRAADGSQITLGRIEEVEVKAGQTTTVNLVVRGVPRQVEITSLATRYIGEQAQLLTIGPATGSAYQVRVANAATNALLKTNVLNEPIVRFNSYSGEKVDICIQDMRGRFATVCRTVTIGETDKPKLAFELVERAAVKGILPAGMTAVSVYLYELAADGKKTVRGIYRKEGAFRLSLPNPSTYTFEVKAMLGDRAVGITRTFTAAEGQVFDLGLLEPQTNGVFQNRAGNTLEVIGIESTQGGVIRLRGTYRYDNQTKPLTEAKLLLPIPGGTSLIAGSVVVNGKPATVAGADTAQATVELPAPMKEGDNGTIYYELRTTEAAGEFVQPELNIRFVQDGAAAKEENIGLAQASLVTVDLDAPTYVTKRTLLVSGHAPVGSTVIIEDGGLPVGHAETSPGGTWQQTITLSGAAQGAKHKLTVQALRDGQEWRSEPVFTVYDPNRPVPLELTLDQPGIRSYKADVSGGVARFPFTLSPNRPIYFSVKFSTPSRVENAVLKVAGDEFPLTLNPLTGLHETVKLTYQWKLGGISVAYDVVPLPYEAGSPTEEEVKAQLPEALQNASVRVTEIEAARSKKLAAAAGESSRVYVATVEVAAADDPEDRIESRYYYEPVPDYQPPSLPAGSPPVWDLKYSYDASTKTGGFSAIVPVTEARKMMQSLGVVAPLEADVHAIIRIGADTKFEIKTPGAGTALGLASAIYSGYEFQSKMNELNAMMDQVMDSGCMPPHYGQYYSNQLQALSERLFSNLVVKYSMQLGAMGLAASGIGFLGGAAVFATSLAVGMKMASDWNDSFNELKAEFASDNAECEDEPQDPSDPPPDDRDDDGSDTPGNDPDTDLDLADPDWIYDPSGYVFEAVKSNRLEGVTATIMQEGKDGEWSVWNAARYLQINPLVTDGEGRYGWDVPEGNWMVRYEKDGYITGYSEKLTVLPPHFDVNIPLVSLEAPAVGGVIQSAGNKALIVEFSKYMQPDTLTAETVRLLLQTGESEETEVPIQIEPLDGEYDAGGRLLATGYRVIAQSPLATGSTYRLVIDADVHSYAGVSLQNAYEQTVAIADTAPPVAEAVLEASVVPGIEGVGIQWTTTEAAGPGTQLAIHWKRKDASDLEGTLTVKATDGFAAIDGLREGGYEIRLATLSRDGVESAGITLEGSPLGRERLPVETTPPAEVASAAALAKPAAIELGWTDPGDPDLRHILVRLRKPGNAEFESPVRVAAGVGKQIFAGLSAGTYDIRVTSVDIRGNESAGIALQAIVPPVQPSEEAIIKIVKGQEVYEALERSLSLRVAKGSLSEGSEIRANRQTKPSHAIPAPYKLRSALYTLTSSAVLSKPVQLSLAFDKSGLTPLELRKLGMYRQDPKNPLKWHYVGGAIDPATGKFKASIVEWGAYAVMLFDLKPKDLEKHWSRQLVEVLLSRHVMLRGTEDGTFEPDRAITRAEMVGAMAEVYARKTGQPYSPVGQLPFKDVPADAWYAPAVATALKAGLLASGTSFRPNDALSREEMSLFIARLIKKTEPGNRGAASALAEAGGAPVGTPTGPGAPSPLPKASRAEAAVLLFAVLEIEAPGAGK